MTITKISGAVTPIAEADKINEIIDNQTELQTALNAKANDSDVVHKTGDETITGKKTFARAIDQSAATWTAMIPIQDTNTDFTVNPTYSKDYYLVQMLDKNGKLGTWVTSQYKTDGEMGSYLNVRTRNTNNTNDISSHIGVMVKRDGTIKTSAPTPATTDNSTQIATTAFVKAQGYAVDSGLVHTTGDEIINGVKTFKSALIQETANTAAGSFVDFKQYINGDRRGTIRTAYNSDGSYQITLGCNGPNASAPEGIYVQRNSISTWTGAPTPDTSDNSTQIATTAYVNNKHQVVSTLPASPDANVYYYIPE